MGRDLLLVKIESEATLSDDAHGILLLWRRDRVRRVAEVEAATRALLLLATEGDTKVGAGQSQERGLSRQTENDHHTVTPPFGNISPDWPASHFVFIRGDAARTMGSQDDVHRAILLRNSFNEGESPNEVPQLDSCGRGLPAR